MVQKNMRYALWAIFIFQILNLESSYEETALSVAQYAEKTKESFDEIQKLIDDLGVKVADSKKNLSENLYKQVSSSFEDLKNNFLPKAQEYLDSADKAAKEAILLPEKITKAASNLSQKAELEDELYEKLKAAKTATEDAGKLLDACKTRIDIFKETLADRSLVTISQPEYSKKDITVALELADKDKLRRDIKFRELAKEGMNDEEIKQIEQLISDVDETIKIWGKNGAMGEFAARKYLKEHGISLKADQDSIVAKIVKMQSEKGSNKKSSNPDNSPKKDQQKVEIPEDVEKWAQEFKDSDPEQNRMSILKGLKAKNVDPSLFPQIMVRITQIRAGNKLSSAQMAVPAQARVEQQAAVKDIQAAAKGMSSLFDQIKARRNDDQDDAAKKLQDAQQAQAKAKTESDRQRAQQAAEKARVELEMIQKRNEQYLQSLEALFFQQEILQQQLFDEAISAATKTIAQNQLNVTKEQREKVVEQLALLESKSITKDFMSYVARKASTWVKNLPNKKTVAYVDIENISPVAQNFTQAETFYVQGFLQSQLL